MPVYELLCSDASLPYEPAHDKTYKKTCVISKDSEQPEHSSSKTRVLFHPLDSPDAVEATCDQGRL